ncbi:MAG: peptidoglycan editing factor PgeF [Lachnospiraceae bacterium]|nr:peptidoglycan editing factor PgeF [Lachnospiraceae bacterium]
MIYEFQYKNDKSILDLTEHAGVPFLEFTGFRSCKNIVHGFSTRMGGVSEGIYESMNLSYTRGDQEAAVTENFRRFAKALEVDPQNYVFSHQTHTINIRVVTEKDRGKGFVRQQDYHDIDGLITNVPELVLSTFYADCVPLFFVDPVRSAIGLSHSGWRGTVGKIGQKTIEKMHQEYGSKPEDILVGIAPSICRECYEVSEDVAEEFRKIFPKEEWKEIMDDKGNGKYQLDLWECNRRILLNSGIRKENLFVTNICTCCNSRLLFSHRASEGKRGNLGAFLMLKQTEE